MTKFSFEIPLNHLKHFDEDQDFLFALSFLFKEEKYCAYIESSARERQVWIDNSTNELRLPDNVKDLHYLFNTFNADFVLAPDLPDWNQETMLQTWLAMSAYTSKVRTFCVIHHPDWIGHFKSYGVKHFAVPYDFRYCSISKLKRFGECHFLGLISIDEIKIAQPPTCDTSMPIKLALQGQHLAEWIQAGCPHIHSTPNFFNEEMSLEQIKLAKQNIKELRAALEEEDMINYPPHYNKGKIEVLDFIQDQDLPYLPATVLKYICRYRFKNGLEDLKKAEFYLKKLIKESEDEGLSTQF